MSALDLFMALGAEPLMQAGAQAVGQTKKAFAVAMLGLIIHLLGAGRDDMAEEVLRALVAKTFQDANKEIGLNSPLEVVRESRERPSEPFIDPVVTRSVFDKMMLGGRPSAQWTPMSDPYGHAGAAAGAWYKYGAQPDEDGQMQAMRYSYGDPVGSWRFQPFREDDQTTPVEVSTDTRGNTLGGIVPPLDISKVIISKQWHQRKERKKRRKRR
jgi:hypothetical protein